MQFLWADIHWEARWNICTSTNSSVTPFSELHNNQFQVPKCLHFWGIPIKKITITGSFITIPIEGQSRSLHCQRMYFHTVCSILNCTFRKLQNANYKKKLRKRKHSNHFQHQKYTCPLSHLHNFVLKPQNRKQRLQQASSHGFSLISINLDHQKGHGSGPGPAPRSFCKDLY